MGEGDIPKSGIDKTTMFQIRCAGTFIASPKLLDFPLFQSQ